MVEVIGYLILNKLPLYLLRQVGTSDSLNCHNWNPGPKPKPSKATDYKDRSSTCLIVSCGSSP